MVSSFSSLNKSLTPGDRVWDGHISLCVSAESLNYFYPNSNKILPQGKASTKDIENDSSDISYECQITLMNDIYDSIFISNSSTLGWDDRRPRIMGTEQLDGYHESTAASDYQNRKLFPAIQSHWHCCTRLLWWGCQLIRISTYPFVTLNEMTNWRVSWQEKRPNSPCQQKTIFHKRMKMTTRKRRMRSSS